MNVYILRLAAISSVAANVTNTLGSIEGVFSSASKATDYVAERMADNGSEPIDWQPINDDGSVSVSFWRYGSQWTWTLTVHTVDPTD